MDKVQLYLQIVPLPVLIGAPVVFAFIVLLTPKRHLLPLALLVLPGWHDLGRMPELGTISAIGKVTSVGAFALVLVAAMLYPGKKRSLPRIVWFYPVFGIAGIPFVMSTVDRDLALVLQVQWTVLSLSAIAVVRCITSLHELKKLAAFFAIGAALALMLPFSSIIFNPGSVRWRFFPWGASPNQIGCLFIMAPPMCLYMAMQLKGIVRKSFFLMAAAAGGFMGLISASRSVVLLLIPLCGVVLIHTVKRPSILIITALIVALSAGWMSRVTVNTDFARVSSLHTDRANTVLFFLQHEIAARPITGLLGTSGKQARDSELTGSHSHNAYIEQMYMFGVLLGGLPIPMLFYSLWCAWKVYLARRYVFDSSTLPLLLCTFMVAIYAHGFENSSIYYATYSWAFFHVTLSCFFIGMWDSLKRGGDGYGSVLNQEYAWYDDGGWYNSDLGYAT